MSFMPRFALGRTVVTRTCLAAMQELNVNPNTYLMRHWSCDWGDLTNEDKQANELALERGDRLLSKYEIQGMEAIYVISEADRSATTMCLVSEY
jgi:hypothetical protein